MNRLLTHYCVDVQHPEVSGAEHLEMLKIRDQLSDVEATLSEAERQQLAEADRLLVMQAEVVSRGLLKFLNLSQHRQTTHIPPERWWYLDVVRHVPYLGQVKKAITSIKKDVFLTGDVLRVLKGHYYSDTKTPAGASRNAQFGKFLKRNALDLGIIEVESLVRTKDDAGNRTTNSRWRKSDSRGDRIAPW